MRRSLLSLSIIMSLSLYTCKTSQSQEAQKTQGGKVAPSEIKSGNAVTNKDSLYKVNPQPIREAPKPGRPN